jgi:hypothetical protein
MAREAGASSPAVTCASAEQIPHPAEQTSDGRVLGSYRRVTSAASSQTARSWYLVSDIRTYTSRPVQPSATVSMYSSPSSAQAIRA